MIGTPDAPLPMAGGVLACWTGRGQGDLGIAAPGDVDARRRAVVDRPWAWLRQVHGAVVVRTAGGAVRGPEGDALVSAPPTDGPAPRAESEPALAIFTADCASVALSSPEGVMAGVHAGWGGLRAGVISAAVQAMRQAGASRITAALGPCIHPECYEFSPVDLDTVVDVLGAGVRGVTAQGRPALDVPAAVAVALEGAGAELVFDLSVCTACSTEHWSHRARQDPQRQALVMWRP